MAATKKAEIIFRSFFVENIRNGSGKTKFVITPRGGTKIVTSNSAARAAKRIAPSVSLRTSFTTSPLNIKAIPYFSEICGSIQPRV